MKKILFLMIAVTMTTAVVAQNLTKEQLYNRAQAFAAQMHHTKALPQLQTLTMNCCPGITVYNVENGGFVVACGDERVRTILGYSDQGGIDPNNLSPELAYWLGEYSSQLQQLGDATLQELQNGEEPSYSNPGAKDFPASVSPLLTTTWTQNGFGYNSKCPVDSSLVDEDYHPTVGCAALAMAQVIRFWQYPIHGRGNHSYSRQGDYDCWRYGTLSADFAHTTYDYANMPTALNSSSTTAQIDAVATLAYHCGVAVGMCYNDDCQGSSGAGGYNQMTAMKRYFHYAPEAQYKIKANHTDQEWINWLKTDLSNGRPVLYSGESKKDSLAGTEGGGHAFVCDGYDTAGMFHFNWGWGGSGDGYFALSALCASSNLDFKNNQTATFGLYPYPGESGYSLMVFGSNLEVNSARYGDSIRGSYSIANVGDVVGEIDAMVVIYPTGNQGDFTYVDGENHFVIQPGDTDGIYFTLLADSLPAGPYKAVLQFCDMPITSLNLGFGYFDDNYYRNEVSFNVTGTQGITTADADAHGLKLYPNPAKNQVTVDLSTLSSSSTLMFYNTLGQLMLRQPVQSSTATIDLSTFAPGIYIVRCGTEVRKLVVK